MEFGSQPRELKNCGIFALFEVAVDFLPDFPQIVATVMPEKTPTQVARAWREQYEKGLAALQRNNFDYAITIFMQVLASEPGFYECRQALRATQFKKAGGGTGFFKKVFSGASKSPLLAKGQLALRSNPHQALQTAEEILNSDPNSAQAHKLLADAALIADFPRTAVLSLEILYKNSPTDRDLALELGEAYTRAGLIDKAEALYTELQRVYPNDLDVPQLLKDLSARRTLSEEGYQKVASGEGSYRDILKDKEEAVSIEQEHREVKSADVADKLINEKEIQLQTDPQNSKLVRSIAELYVQKKSYDRALEYYTYLNSITGGTDPAVEKEITDVTLRKLDQEMASMDPASPDYAEKSEQLKKEKAKFALSEAKKRSERYPSDLQIRFDLARLYYENGMYSEAIQEFQKAQANPNRRVQSLGYLGLCFAARGMNDLAARKLEDAIKEKVVFDDEKKELIYNLGVVFEKMGKPELAIEQFKQIYETDIGYKDVSARVDAYYAAKS